MKITIETKAPKDICTCSIPSLVHTYLPTITMKGGTGTRELWDWIGIIRHIQKEYGENMAIFGAVYVEDKGLCKEDNTYRSLWEIIIRKTRKPQIFQGGSGKWIYRGQKYSSRILAERAYARYVAVKYLERKSA